MATPNTTSLAASNIYKFPHVSKFREAHFADGETKDDLFMRRLHSLPLLDQEIWHSCMELACALLKAGYNYEVEVTKQGRRK